MSDHQSIQTGYGTRIWKINVLQCSHCIALSLIRGYLRSLSRRIKNQVQRRDQHRRAKADLPMTSAQFLITLHDIS